MTNNPIAAISRHQIPSDILNYLFPSNTFLHNQVVDFKANSLLKSCSVISERILSTKVVTFFYLLGIS